MDIERTNVPLTTDPFLLDLVVEVSRWLMMGCLSLALELNEKSQTGAMLPSAGERENQSG